MSLVLRPFVDDEDDRWRYDDGQMTMMVDVMDDYGDNNDELRIILSC